MQLPLLMKLHTQRLAHGLTMEGIYEYLLISRQGFYKAVKRLKAEQNMMAQIQKLVLVYRLKKDRRAGSRSLYYNLGIKNKYGIGVTKFENLMSQYGLTLVPCRIKVVTTQSCLQSWNYSNLCNGLVINNINQLVVGDITYIVIGKVRYYLFCLTDVYSERIGGYHLSQRMRKQEGLSALKMLIKLRGDKSLTNCIHHTDGGGQYFSGDYLEVTSNINMQTSVARSCLENGYAEQKNGFLKNHLLPTLEHNEGKGLVQSLKKAVEFYNSERKQQELGWLSPVEFERAIEKNQIKQELTLHDHINNIPSKRERFF